MSRSTKMNGMSYKHQHEIECLSIVEWLKCVGWASGIKIDINWVLINFPFSSIFSCTSRFVGEFCEYSNPCHTGPGPRCQNGGTCVVTYKDSVPGFTCRCPIGFTASLCEIPEKNVCDSGPCQNGGTCNLQSLEKYSCSCSQGYGGKCYWV